MVQQKLCFPRLVYQMLMKKWTMQDLSDATGMNYNTLRRKMYNQSAFLLDEAIAIKKALKCDLPIEMLFERNE